MTTPICQNCRHRGAYVDVCHRRAPIKFNPVTGGTTKVLREQCADERKRSWFTDKCGPDGKYWEAKP